MKKSHLYFGSFILVMAILFSCKTDSATVNKHEVEAKVLGNADAKSEALSAKVMAAMGGQDKWDDLNYVSWTFFGSRHLVWDKLNGRVRIESPKDSSVYLIDLTLNKCQYAKDGILEKDENILVEKYKRGEGIWINDSYWLVMPFKLRDNGVNLKYLREDTTIGGQEADVLELTFKNVGNTPNNKYEVYVDKNDKLIKQWDFFKDATQEKASRQWPWDNYQDHNGLLLSSDRSDNGGPSNVRVYESLDDKVFTSFDEFKFY